MQNAVALLPDANEWTQLKEMGLAAYKSGLLPSSIKTAEAATIIMLKGREIGLPPMAALAHIHIVNGRPGCSAEIMLAEIRIKHPKAIIKFKQQDAKGCIIEAARLPEDKVETFSFMFDEAIKAGLSKKEVWQSYPSDMCFARAVTRMKRRLFTEVLSGLSHTPEELEDLKDVTPQAKDAITSNVTELKPQTIKTEAPAVKNYAPQSQEAAENWQPSDSKPSDPEQNGEATQKLPLTRKEIAAMVGAQAQKAGYTKDTFPARVRELTGKTAEQLTDEELMDLATVLEIEATNKQQKVGG